MGYKSKPLLITVATLGALTGLGALGAMQASAHTTNSSTIVEKIASTFNLQKDEVQAVFDEVKDEKHAEMQERLSERLQAKVDSGDITPEQKTAIDTKLEELHQKRETTHESLQKWANENSIDMKFLRTHRHDSESSILEEAVANGEISAEQKTAIEAKREELRKLHDSEKESLSAWAKELGISIDDILPFGGKRSHHFGR